MDELDSSFGHWFEDKLRMIIQNYWEKCFNIFIIYSEFCPKDHNVYILFET